MSALDHLWPRVVVRDGDDERATTKRPALAAVPDRAPQRMARVPFLAFLGALLGLGMVGLVLLNTAIQSQAAELAKLNGQATRLENEQSALTAQVQWLRSSSNLTQAAQKLGMRPNPHPAFIVLPDGVVVGTPTPVTGKEMPEQAYKSWQQVQSEIEAERAKVAAQAKAAEEARKKKAEAEAAKKKAEAEKNKNASPNPSKSPSTTTSTAGGR